MHHFKLLMACLSALAVSVPVLAEPSTDSTRHDPYAGYRGRGIVHRSDGPQRVDHQPRIIRTKPLIRTHTYRNAPEPVESRVRSAAVHQVQAHDRTGQALVRTEVHRPASTLVRHDTRYEDIGQPRVIRNPLLHDNPRYDRSAIISPFAPVHHDRYLDSIRDHRGLSNGVIRIRSAPVFNHHAKGHHRIHRPYYGSQIGWHHRGHHIHHRRHHHHGSFIRIGVPIHSHCHTSSSVSLYFRF